MPATPFWFGGRDRPLFGWFHTPPNGAATGGVVLCPPLGIEAICTYFTYRVLAERLAERGIAVLRFDYDGTGDSFGDQEDPGRVEAWLGSVAAATDFVVGAGVSSVGLVGIRMGALFAANEAARRGGSEALVLWDPCVSGQSFLREQQAFRMLSLGGEDSADGSVEAPGLRFSPDAALGLSELEIPTTTEALARRCLVLTHPERPQPRRLARRMAGTDLEWGEATGQGALLDPPRQEPPYETIDRVVDWVAKGFTAPPAPVSIPESGSAVVGTSRSGGDVVERPVSLGPLGLFGIVTERAGAVISEKGTTGADIPEAPGTTIVFVDEGNTPHIGQSRMWVELARSWAAEGLRVLRFDLSGNGDSGVRPGQLRHLVRSSESFRDLEDVRRAISPHDPSNVVLVGLCSGAYQAMEEGLISPPRGVCAINPILTFPLPDESGTTRPVRRQVRQMTRPWVRAAGRYPLRWAIRRWAQGQDERWSEAFEFGRWPAATARRVALPDAVWWVVNHVLLEHRTMPAFERLVGAGVDTLLVCGEEDLQPIALAERRTLRRLERSGRFHLAVLPELDHAGLLIEQRSALKRVLTEHVVTRFGPGIPTDEGRVVADRTRRTAGGAGLGCGHG